MPKRYPLIIPPTVQLSVPGTLASTTNLSQVEVVVGGLYFDPTLYTSLALKFRLVGELTTTDGAGTGLLRLYDTGDGVSAFSPVLRSTRTLVFADVGKRLMTEVALTLSGSPGVDADEVFNVARTYELRLYINTAVASVLTASWGGLVGTYTG